jgi:hypothetical protein
MHCWISLDIVSLVWAAMMCPGMYPVLSGPYQNFDVFLWEIDGPHAWIGKE